MKQRRRLAEAISRLCMPPPESSVDDTVIQALRNKEGRLLTTVENQLAKWKEHFQKVLNRPASEQGPQLNSGDSLDINIRGFSCQVIHAGKLSESFEVSSRARQGCLLSPLLILVVLDWVTKKAYRNSGKGIQLSLTTWLYCRTVCKTCKRK